MKIVKKKKGIVMASDKLPCFMIFVPFLASSVHKQQLRF